MIVFPANTSLPIMDLDEDILADTYLVSSDKAGPSNAVTCPSPVTRPVVSREEAVSSEVEPSVMDTEAASSEPCSKTTGKYIKHHQPCVHYVFICMRLLSFSFN